MMLAPDKAWIATVRGTLGGIVRVTIVTLATIFALLICLGIVWLLFVAAADGLSWLQINAGVAQSAASLVQALFALILIGVTLVYVRLTHALVQQGKNANRPVVMPQSSRPHIAPWKQTDAAEGEYLKLVNIGSGSALNIRCRLEEGFEKDLTRNSTDITEERTIAKALTTLQEGIVYNYNSGKPYCFRPWCWLTISYDDVYGRHFETEARWNGHDWLGFAPREVKKPAPYFSPDLPPHLNAGV